MKNFRLLLLCPLVLFSSACVTGQTAWQYYDQCANQHSSFEKMVACGKQARTEGCALNNTCSARGDALVQYADSLVISVKSKELSEAEARRRWIEYRTAEENAYSQDLNAALARRAVLAP